jgi:DNA-binding PadR family transcriptional regulator
MSKKELDREILLSVWKIHILHHAAQMPVIGQWVIRELRHHGYEASPGTIYPLLARMARRGWLHCTVDPGGGLKAKREYSLTELGHLILDELRVVVKELHHEVIEEVENKQ